MLFNKLRKKDKHVLNGFHKDSFMKKIDGVFVQNTVMRLLAAFFLISGFCVFWNTVNDGTSFKTLEYVREIDIFSIVCATAAVFVSLSILRFILSPRKKETETASENSGDSGMEISQYSKIGRPRYDAYFMLIGFLWFALITLFNNDSFYYVFGISAIMAAMLFYLLKNNLLKELYKLKTWHSVAIIAFGAVIVCAFVGFFCVIRYRIYYSSTFDLGIAGQMYYYMKETLTPMTTCERDVLLSHFAVHFTPIYYLLLPVYFVFPYIETLLIAQPILIVLGVIPLFLICKHRGFSPAVNLCIGIAYIFSLAAVAPNFYDFHETAFIPVMMLWFFYFMEKQKWIPMYVFLGLTLCCKEDVSVSMACIGAYMLLSGGKSKSTKFHGAVTAAVSVCFFLIITALLEKYGDGTFSHRFNSLMAQPENGITEIIRTVITDPAFIIQEAFKEDKFIFLFQLFVPVGFLPFLTKRAGHFLLLVPTFLVCLLPEYYYQHNIDYQYVFGMIPMLFYITAVNISEFGTVKDSGRMPEENSLASKDKVRILPSLQTSVKKYVLPVMAAAAVMFTFSHITPKSRMYKAYTDWDKNKIEIYEMYLSKIPEEASVEATHMFVPRLSQRRHIYSITNDNVQSKWGLCDYVVMKVGPGLSDEDREFTQRKTGYLLRNGYEYAFGDDREIAVYRLKSV
ncbi:MAG: DUF2079 domain-containing protein [Oscillospiraceae bacterium]|jgi:uncharacterized membrane protein|nr:DUF2079 domain-containing protein [Oscillospiraceae bacterium]